MASLRNITKIFFSLRVVLLRKIVYIQAFERGWIFRFLLSLSAHSAEGNISLHFSGATNFSSLCTAICYENVRQKNLAGKEYQTPFKCDLFSFI